MMTKQTWLPQLDTLLAGPIRQELSFPTSEYEARIVHATAALNEHKLDLLISSHLPNLCYLTGYQFTNSDYSSFLLLRRNGESTMVVPGTEVSTVLLHGPVRDVLDCPSWKPFEALPLIEKRIKQWGLEGGRIGTEPQFEIMDPFFYASLRKMLPKATFVDASDLIVGFRAVKTPSELDHLRHAARYTDYGMQTAFSEIRPGRSENDVAASASEAMIQTGSEYFSTAPMIASGARTSVPSAMFKRATIRAGDPVIIEMAGVHHRYSTPLARTAVIGKPSAELRRLARTALGSLEALLKTVEPGRSIKDAAKAARRKLGSVAGEIWPLPSFGHSVGVGMPPTWVEGWLPIDESNERPFEVGMVFHSPVHLCIPGKLGVCFSECWVVTENGAMPFSRVARALHEIDA